MVVRNDFPRAARLLHAEDFARVYAAHNASAIGPLVMYAAKRDGLHSPRPRLGLSVSRKIGGAVVRNRWKRHLREAFRQVQEELNPHFDFIIVVRSGLPQAGAMSLNKTRRLVLRLATRVIDRLRQS
ncbi:MAG: ribonuclease P protein component [Pirellulales bacterium]